VLPLLLLLLVVVVVLLQHVILVALAAKRQQELAAQCSGHLTGTHMQHCAVLCPRCCTAETAPEPVLHLLAQLAALAHNQTPRPKVDCSAGCIGARPLLLGALLRKQASHLKGLAAWVLLTDWAKDAQVCYFQAASHSCRPGLHHLHPLAATLLLLLTLQPRKSPQQARLLVTAALAVTSVQLMCPRLQVNRDSISTSILPSAVYWVKATCAAQLQAVSSKNAKHPTPMPNPPSPASTHARLERTTPSDITGEV
jgi:hypothetical protein